MILRPALILATTLTIACGSESPAPERNFLPCNILDTNCQARITQMTSDIRGRPLARPPPITVMTEDEYRRWLLAHPEPNWPGDKPVDRALQRLGLLTTTEDPEDVLLEVYVTRTAAFYDLNGPRVVLIDRGTPLDDWRDVDTLAHEITHYLQDRTIGLNDFWRRNVKTTDNAAASDSLIEGEAVWVAELVIAQARQEMVDDVDWTAYFEDWQFDWLAEEAQTDSVLDNLLLTMPYPTGGHGVAKMWEAENSWASVEQTYADPRGIFADWMSPDQLIQPPHSEALDCPPPPPPPGHQAYAWDQLGALGLVALLVAHEVPSPVAWGWARHWQAGAQVFYRKASTGADLPEITVAWRVRFDSNNVANQVADALHGPLEVTQNDRAMTIWASTHREIVSEDFDRALCGTDEDWEAIMREARRRPRFRVSQDLRICPRRLHTTPKPL